MPEIREQVCGRDGGEAVAVAADRWMLWVLSDPGSPLARWRESSWMKRVTELYRHRLNGDEPTPEKWEAAANGASSAVLRKCEKAAEAQTGPGSQEQKRELLAARATA